MRTGLRERSLQRMEEIATYYSEHDGVLAVAAFGSNADRERFDEYSDLDFLVFVAPEAKVRLIEEVGSLSLLGEIDALRVVYGDAVQLLFSDGVLCDFGIILPQQLATFPHGKGRYLWKREGWKPIDLSALEPAWKSEQELTEDALFHLYVGLLRVGRGEEAAAFDEIQVNAANSVLTLLQQDRADAFSPLRCVEQRVSPDVLQQLMPGYGRSSEAAKDMLKFLSEAKELPLYQAVARLLEEIFPNQ